MQVLDGCARLPVGHEVATFQVEGDVQEVGGGGVALGLKLEIVGGEDGDDLLHDLVHLLGREIAREQGVVPVEAAFDGEINLDNFGCDKKNIFEPNMWSNCFFLQEKWMRM